MRFTKMQGIGNDYIYFNCLEQNIADPEKLSIALSDRHFGVGGDGIVMILPSENADFRMRIFNADGSEAKMCGNATRCIGKYVYDRGLTDKTEISLETNSGIKYLKLFPEDGKVKSVLVNMGKYITDPAQIPVTAAGESFIAQKITVLDREYTVTCVSMGNPHCVVISDIDPDDIPLEKTGRAFEFHPLFPDRINTEFIKITDGNTAKMRVWERGSGETLACGTGACAAASACVLNGLFREDVENTIHLRGGDLFITVKSDRTVLMRGTAEFVFDGEVDI
ncbi:MAG: diaminopimelate epimerase [Oscillospiraceae bacterium]|nr:diaminopimelate epimerase [Oscillospiraceae bacterium]